MQVELITGSEGAAALQPEWSRLLQAVPHPSVLGSAEPYKLHWTDRTVPHYRFRGYPPTIWGRARHGYRNRLRPAVKQAMTRLQLPVGRR
jgi:hypothetical protein